MKNNVNFDHSTLLGDVEFTSHWNNDGVFFYSTGHDSNGDGVLDTNGGWVDDAQNVDELNITLNNGSKWVGSANMSAEVIAPADMYDVAPNSLTLVPPSKLMIGAVLLTTKYSRAAYLT